MDTHKGNALITDYSLWFKHIEDDGLRNRLSELDEDEPIALITDGVVGTWRRMKQGKNPRPTEGLRPTGAMRDIWRSWFETRKGDRIWVSEIDVRRDEYLAAGSALFSEWSTPEDEEAFRDL